MFYIFLQAPELIQILILDQVDFILEAFNLSIYGHTSQCGNIMLEVSDLNNHPRLCGARLPYQWSLLELIASFQFTHRFALTTSKKIFRFAF